MKREWKVRVARAAVYAGLVGAALLMATPAEMALAQEGSVTLQVERVQKSDSNTQSLKNYVDSHGADQFDSQAERTVLLSTDAASSVQEVAARAEATGLKVLGKGTLLFSGVWVRGSFSAIESALTSDACPLVVSISDSHEHPAPVWIDNTIGRRHKRDIYSNELIAANKNLYTGAGKFIAVVDTGLDIGSPEFQPLTPEDNPKITSAEALAALKEKAGVEVGKFISTKVPFAYNYADDTDDTTGSHEHGTHVSGIILGNPPAEYGQAEGVLPKAQLAAMKVSDSSGTFGDWAVSTAMEDAVKLGVDTINCSWGVSGADTSQYYNVSVLDAIEKAQQLGIIVSFAAGNEATVGTNTPIEAKYVDYGVPLAPSSLSTNLTVASMNNSKMITRAVTIGDEQIPAGAIQNIDKMEGLYDTDIEAVAVPGLGKESDYEGIDVSGKAAVIARGELTFAEKACIAREHGARFVVITNYEGTATFTMTLGDETQIPAMLVSYEDGQKLRQVKKLQVGSQEIGVNYPEARLMSDFTSWKTDANLTGLTPDITGPGGFIYSSVENGKFGLESGTSMATPHVSAVAAVVKDHAKELLEAKKAHSGEDYTQADVFALTNQLLMTYAVPQVVNNASQQNVLVSPRQQGAGLVNLDRSMKGSVVLVGDANKSSKIAKIDENGIMTFSVTLRNYTSEPKTYSYRTSIQTDEVNRDGKYTFLPYFEKETEAQSVTVEPFSDKELSFTIDISDTSTHPDTVGNFVDAFVRFEGQDGALSMSLPVSSFRGDFNAAPIFEENVYDMLARGVFPVFWEKSFDADGVFHNNFTHLSSVEVMPTSTTDLVLGSVMSPNYDTNSWDMVDFDKEHIAISPNGDGLSDSLRVQVTAIRTARNVEISYYNEKNERVAGPFDAGTGLVDGITKNYAVPDGDNYDAGHTELFAGRLTADKAQLADGHYTVQISAVPDTAPENTRPQTISMPFIVDTKVPEPKHASYDAERRTYTISGITDAGSGVREVELVGANTTILPLVQVKHASDLTDTALSFEIPDGVELSDLKLVAKDYANNILNVPVSSTLAQEGSYNLVVSAPYLESEPQELRYSVQDATGATVDPTEYANLKEGSYTVVIDKSSLPKGYVLKGGLSYSFAVGPDNPTYTLALELQELETANVSAYVTKTNYYGKVAPELVNSETGERFALEADEDFPNYFSAQKVPVGTYVVEDKTLKEGATLTQSPNPLVLTSDKSSFDLDITYTGRAKDDTPVNNLYIKAGSDNEYTEPLTFIFTGADGKHTYEVTTTDSSGAFSTSVRKNMAQGDYSVSLKDVPAGYVASYPETYTLGDSFYYEFVYSLKKESEPTPVTKKVAHITLAADAFSEVEGAKLYLQSGDTKLELIPGQTLDVDLGDAAEKTFNVVAENLPEAYSYTGPAELTLQDGATENFVPTFEKKEAGPTDSNEGAIPEGEARVKVSYKPTDALTQEDFTKLNWAFVNAKGERFSEKDGALYKVVLGENDTNGAPAPSAYIPVIRLLAAALPTATSETLSVEVAGLPEGVTLADDSRTIEVRSGELVTFEPHFVRASTDVGEPTPGENTPGEGTPTPGGDGPVAGSIETETGGSHEGETLGTVTDNTLASTTQKLVTKEVRNTQLLPKTSDPAIALPFAAAFGSAALAFSKLIKRKR